MPLRASTASYDQRTEVRVNHSFRDSVSPVRVVQDMVNLEEMKKKADKFVMNSEPHNPAKASGGLLPKPAGGAFSMKRSYSRRDPPLVLIDERNIRLR